MKSKLIFKRAAPLLAILICFGMLFTALNFAVNPTTHAAPSSPENSKVEIEQVDVDSVQVLSRSKPESGLYIVRLEEAPVASYRGGIPGLRATNPAVTGRGKLDVERAESVAYRTYLVNRQAQVQRSIERAVGHSVKVRFQYQLALNGMAVELTAEEAARVAKLDGVKSVTPDWVEYAQTDAGPAWMGAAEIWGGGFNNLPFTAPLSGDNEVPPVATTASGLGTFSYNLDTRVLTYTIEVSDIMSITAAHIHSGTMGVNGPPLHTLYNGTGPFDPNYPISGTVTLTEEQQGQLMNKGLYINVHTQSHPPGEIRGQIESDGSMGEGIVVGIVDTGTNIDHPSFAEVGGDGYVHINPRGKFYGWCDPDHADYDPSLACNNKLIGLWSGDEDSPEDAQSHGSHVGGTVAGNVLFDAVINAPTTAITMSRISGVAPHANIIGYNIEATAGSGSAFGTTIVAATEQAIADQVDVINYSFGGGNGNPWTASDYWFNVREAGIFVATSAGNSGSAAATLGSPGNSPWMLTVGSSSHNRVFSNVLMNLTGGDTTPPADINGEGVTSGYGPAPIVYAGTIDPNNPGCDLAYPADTFNGEIVVCDYNWGPQYGGRVNKSINLAEGGAGGFILINRVDWAAAPMVDSYAIPGMGVPYDKGEELKTWLASGTGHQASIRGVMNEPARGDIMAGFSSRGPISPPGIAADFIKPDVTAPGRRIVAAIGTTNPADPPEFDVFQGTSMSSPHAAGAAALMRALHPNWSVAEIQSALMTTALNNGVLKEDATTQADPFDMGAGRVDLSVAAHAGLVLDETPDNLWAANPTDGGDPKALNLASMANSRCVVTCSWTRTVSSTLGITQSWQVSTSGATNLTVEPMTFTLAAGATQMLSITADVNGLPPEEWAFGEVMLSPVGNDQIPPAHMPVALFPSPSNLPDHLDVVAVSNQGSQFVEDLQAIDITELTIAVDGLVKGTLTDEMLSQDPTSSDPYDNLNDGTVFFLTMTVPADAPRLVAEIIASQAPDIDLFVGQDTNDDGQPDASEQLCSSTTSSWDEYCSIDHPAAGTWWVVVQNWAASDNPPDAVTLVTAVVPQGPAGNMTVAESNGNTSIPAGTPFDLQVSWDESTMAVGDHWYASLKVGSDAANPANLGTVTVDLIRVEPKAEIAVVPSSLYGLQLSDQVMTYTLSIDNVGYGNDLNWTIAEDSSFLRWPQRESTYVVPRHKVESIGDNHFSRNTNPVVASGALSLPKGSQPASSEAHSREAANTTTLTHSLDQSIMDDNSVACSGGPNSFLRVFELPAFGINDGFNVIKVDVGIENASGVDGSQPAIINLYTLSGTLTFDNLTLIGSAEVNVSDQELSMLTVPVTGHAPVGSTLVVEFLTSHGVDGHVLYPGSNNLGQTDASYIAAPACGAVNPVDIAALGFPDMHLVMNVSGITGDPPPPACQSPSDIPWASVEPISGTTAAGDSTEVMVVFDSSGLDADTYIGNLCVNSDDPDTPLVVVPMILDVPGPEPDIRVAPNALDLLLPSNEQLSETLTIMNVGFVDPLEWTIEEDSAGGSCSAPSDIPWVSVAPVTGTTASHGLTDVLVTFDSMGLAPDTYTGTLCVNSNDPDMPLVEVALSLRVPEPEPLVCDADMATFNQGVIPPDWTVINNGGTCAWESTATIGAPNFTGGDGFAAAADRLWCGTGMNTELHSPVFSLADDNAPNLFYRYDYFDVGGPDQGTVDITIDGGATWENLVTYSDTDFGPANNLIDLSAYAGESNVQVRFTYDAPGEVSWFQVDDVALFCDEATPEIDVMPDAISQTLEILTGYDMLNIANLGTGELNWSLDEGCGTPVEWMALDPISGTTPAFGYDEVMVSFDDLEGPGVYTSSICVNSDDADEPTVTVPVTVTVRSVSTIMVEPEMVVSTPWTNTQLTEMLTISSTGTTTVTWAIEEDAPQIRRPAGAMAPDARRAPAQVGYSTPKHVASSAVLLDEGFEGGVVPPMNWTAVQNNANETWNVHDFAPYDGSYAAEVQYDAALGQQDEWLLSPEVTLTEGTLSFWSMGSVFWCRDINDNCDLNVWLVVGDLGGEDDIFVGKAEDDWPADYVWGQSVFDLAPLLPNEPVRIGFQYYGLDGAQVVLDNIVLDDSPAPCTVPDDIPWLTVEPISGTTAAGDRTEVMLTFDSAGLEFGTYDAHLCVHSDDAHMPLVPVPVSMEVIGPELSIHKHGPPISAGLIEYTLMVHNMGSPAMNLLITDSLPLGTEHVSGGTLVGDQIHWTIDALDHDEMAEVSFVVTATEEMSATISQRAPSIVGGEPAEPGAWPWMASLKVPGVNHWCGGSLIHPEWILTAAHCIEDYTASDFTVVLGRYDITTTEGEEIGVDQIIMHPEYNDVAANNDIALLHLVHAPSNPIPAIPLVNPGNDAPGVLSTITGWGALAEGGSGPDVLHQVSVPIVSQATCEASYPGQITENMICAGLAEGGMDSCQGDSGGPLMVPNIAGTGWEQAGIVSWGNGCAQPEAYGVYARVSEYIEWIAEQGVDLTPSNQHVVINHDYRVSADGGYEATGNSVVTLITDTATIRVEPLHVMASQEADLTSVEALTITNWGNLDLNWEIEENGDGSPQGCSAPSDIPWVTVMPMSGTVAGGESSMVDVTFDSTGLMIHTTYTGVLCINSNDPVTPLQHVRLAMTVEPSSGVELSPHQAMSGAIGGSVVYALRVTNTSDITDTFTLSATGNWTTTVSPSSVMVMAGASRQVEVWVDIPTSASEDDTDTATVTVTSASDSNVGDSTNLTTTALPDEDADGIPNETEGNAPNNGDGNGDGIPDNEQENVASVPNQGSGDNQGYVTLAAPPGVEVVDVVAIPEPEELPEGVEQMPQGVFEFNLSRVTTETVVMTLTLHNNSMPLDTYYKHDESSDTWYEFLYDGTTGAVITDDGQGTTLVVLHFVDGQRGDADGVVNGVIDDPGAPGISTSPTSVELTSLDGQKAADWPLALLAMLGLTLGLGLWYRRRK